MSTVIQTWLAKSDGMYSRGRVTRFTSERDSLVYGTYKPDESTAGVLPGVTRTNYNSPSITGSVTLNTPGMTYQNLNFYGDIIVAAPDVTFINCWFWGGVGHPTGNRGCVSLTGDGNHDNAEFYDCTMSARSPSYYRDGIVGNSYKLFRCNIFNTNDGAGAFSVPATLGGTSGTCNVEIYGCYIHDLVWWRQDPAHDDGTHNDGIQYQGGDHFIASGNNIEGYCVTAEGSTEINTRLAPNGKCYIGSSIIINQNTHPASNVLIENNWLYGGYAQLQLNRGTKFAGAMNISLGTNRYGRDIYEVYAPNSDKRWVCLIPDGGTINATNLYTHQIWDDTGTVLLPGRATGIRTL